MKTFKILFLLIFVNSLYSQNNFELSVKSEHYINDSIWFGVAQARSGFEDLYGFELITNNNIKDLAKNMNLPLLVFSLTIANENKLSGKIDYPQPVSFMYMSKQGYAQTNPFFLEKGNYDIVLPKIDFNVEVDIKTPSNLEYQKLKKELKSVYIKGNNPFGMDSLADFNKKQEIMKVYVKSNPKSYVALWEIINDYTLYNYSPKYLEIMKSFSKDFKKNILYQKFESKLITESKTMIEKKMPNIHFDKEHSLTELDFKKYKLTVIDFWSTTCPPCIKSMPELVELYKEFKDKNVNFICVTDENEPRRIELAKTILKKNNVTWTNFFDINKEFGKNVNATSYPIQFVVDENGFIVARVYGDLEEIRNVLNKTLK